MSFKIKPTPTGNVNPEAKPPAMDVVDPMVRTRPTKDVGGPKITNKWPPSQPTRTPFKTK